jgi:RNA polymerase sigma factor (sigma-70 family)
LELKEIIEGCKCGDRRSQNSLVHMFAPRLMAVCMRYVGNRDMAQDALQDTFVNVFKYIHSYSGEGSFEGWLRRIAANCSLNFIKVLKHHMTEDDGIIDTNTFAEVPDIYSQLGHEEIMHLLGKLPQSFNLVFNLYIIEGYNHAEIAHMLHISESTSRSTLCKARNRLIEIMQEEHEKEQKLLKVHHL